MSSEPEEPIGSENNNNNNPTINSRKHLLTNLRSCLDTSDWHVDLALMLTIIHFIWLVHILFDADNWEVQVFTHLWLIFHCLGVFFPEDYTSGNREKLIVVLYHMLQLFVSLSLLWGVHKKRIVRLEFWIFQTLCNCLLAAWWSLNQFLILNDQEDSTFSHPFPLFQSGILLSFYFFNALYVWRIIVLRRKLLLEDSSSSSPPEESRASDSSCVFFLSNGQCLTVSSVITLICIYITSAGAFESLHKNKKVDIGGLIVFLIMGCMSMAVLGLLVRANNRKSLPHVQFWTWVGTFIWISSIFAQFLLIINYEKSRLDLSDIILTRFLALDFPSSVTLFMAYRRILELSLLETSDPYGDVQGV